MADGNAEPVVSFQIKQNAHAMHVLSTSLYKRAEEAVARELICNAVDATKAADSQHPVVVNLQYPNDNFSTDDICNNRGIPAVPGVPASAGYSFIVYDRGTGLCAEDVKALVTVYFGSSKDQNDSNQTGFFGLGAKSPFAVCDEFYISSRWFGSVTTFKAFKDPETGIPCIKEIFQGDTSDDNGLTFVVPTRLDRSKIAPAIFPFSEQQLVLGSAFGADFNKSTRIKRYVKDAVFSCEAGHLVERVPGSSYNNSILGVYKNVLYTLENLVTPNMLLLNGRIRNNYSCVVLEIPSDVQLDMAPSREELRNSTRNFEALSLIAAKFADALAKKLDDAVDLNGNLASWITASRNMAALWSFCDPQAVRKHIYYTYKTEFAEKSLILEGRRYVPSDIVVQHADDTRIQSVDLQDMEKGVIFISPIPQSYVDTKNFTKLNAALSTIKNSSDGAKYKNFHLKPFKVSSKEVADTLAKELKLEKYVYFDWKTDLLAAVSKTATTAKGTLGKIKVYEASFKSKLVLKRFDAKDLAVKDHLWAFADTSAFKRDDKDRKLFMDADLTVPCNTSRLLELCPGLKIIGVEYADTFNGITVGQHIKSKLKELSDVIEGSPIISYIAPPLNSNERCVLSALTQIYKRNPELHKWLQPDLKQIAHALQQTLNKDVEQENKLKKALEAFVTLSSCSYNEQAASKHFSINVDTNISRLIGLVPLLKHVNYSNLCYYATAAMLQDFSVELESLLKIMGYLSH